MRISLIYFILVFEAAKVINGCGRPRRRNVDRTPPDVECPVDITKGADKLQLHTKVYWSEAHAFDDKDGHITVSRTGPAPGRLFSEGRTRITYTARDRSGNHKSCHFYVIVTVTRCKAFNSLPNGWKICHPSDDMRWGGECSFGCYDGHELIGDSSVSCESTGLWTNERQPYCKKTTCPEERPNDSHTRIRCSNKNYYRSICTYFCEKGYDISPGHGRVKVCTASGYWKGVTPVCKDIEPPHLTNCPYRKIFYAGRNSTSSKVWWVEPTASDNSGYAMLRQMRGPKNGVELEVGQYTVLYSAIDEAKNTADCEFNIIVKQIVCPVIYPLPYTSVLCPHGRKYGSECVFGCDENSEMNGLSTTECDSKGSIHYYGRWSFGDYQPYCELKTVCPELTPPNDGALACDVWLDGRFCQSFCRQGYLFNTRAGYDFQRRLLVCGDSGRWNYGLDIPDCVRVNRVKRSRFRLEAVYFYHGPCESALEEIKRNFLTIFSRQRGCENAEKCKIQNVQVACGSSSNRGRRDTNNTSHEVTISAEFEVEPTTEDVELELIQQRQTLRDLLRKDFGNESGLTYKEDTISAPVLECPDGYEPHNKEFKCVECSKGYYHDKETKVCEKCPVGQYQPESQQTVCNICPPGTTTIREGSYNESFCLVACRPGYYSDTGVEPCGLCDQGYYSTEYGTKECTSCPGSQITQFGAKSVDECYDFDLEFAENVTYPAKILTAIDENIDNIVVAFWVQCTSCDNILTFTVTETETLVFKEQENFTIEVNGQEYPSEAVLSVNTLWKFVKIVICETHIRVMVNGESVIFENVTGSRPFKGGSECNITIGGEDFAGSIFNLNIWSNISTGDEREDSPSCSSTDIGNLLNWKQFSELDGDFVQIHSKCDDYDNCQSEPCQNAGRCIDGLSDYTCLCLDGYTGQRCETNIDDCQTNSCDNNSTCIDGVAEYTCLCPEGFNGSLCEIKIVNGGWTDWGECGPCSMTCGNGSCTRSRVCENPPPDNGGQPCDGDNSETLVCETGIECLYDCDTDPTLENGDANCTWFGTTRVCSPYCNRGFDFDSDLFLYDVVCGLETGYTWNIKTPDNPTGQLPSCKEITLAKSNTMYYKGMYTGLDVESVAEEPSESILERTRNRVNSNVNQTTCVMSGRCILLKTEVFAGDKNMGSAYVSFIAYISCDVINDTEECFYQLKDAKETLDDMVEQEAFSMIISSVTYNVDKNSTSIDGISECEAGSAPVFYYCVPCGEGMYQQGNFCEMCPRNTYQDEVGQSSCKKCPGELFTDGLMSRNVSACKAISVEESDYTLIIIAVVVPFCIVLVIAVAVVIARYFRKQKKDVTDEKQELNANVDRMTMSYNPVKQEDSESCPKPCEKEFSDPWNASTRPNMEELSDDCSDSMLTQETKFLKYMDDSD